MIYKYIFRIFLPQYLCCLIQQKTVCNYSLRSQMYYNLNVPSARTNLGTKAFKYAAPSDWNFLQMNLRLNQLVPFRYLKTLLCGLEKDLEICKCFECVLNPEVELPSNILLFIRAVFSQRMNQRTWSSGIKVGAWSAGCFAGSLSVNTCLSCHLSTACQYID